MNIKKIIFLVLFTAIILFSLYRLNGGIVLGEPDEVTHFEVMENFKKGSIVPKSSSGPWYYELPGLPFFGYLFSFIVKGTYIPLRLVSWLGYFSLAVGLYLWGKFRLGKRFGAILIFLWLLCPLAIFYARIGVLDSGSVSFSFLSLLALDYSLRTKRISFGILSGVFLALALLIKYSVLVYVIAFGLFFVVDFISRNLPKAGLKKEIYCFNSSVFLSLLSAFVLVFPVFAYLFFQNSYIFKIHFLTNLSFITDDIRKISSAFNIFTYGMDIIWWISVPIFLFSLLGVILLLLKFRSRIFDHSNNILFFFSFAMVLFALLRQKPFYPRYFLMITPFLIIFSGYFLDKVYTFLKTKFNSTLVFFSATLSLLAFFVVFTLPAWQSTNSSLIEDTVKQVRALNNEDLLVSSNYWPHYFKNATPSGKVTWLSADIRDATVYLPHVTASSLDTLFRDGGFAILEDNYSSFKTMVVNDGKKTAWEQIKKQFQPIFVIKSTSPNFPYLKVRGNEVQVYKVPKS